MGELSNEVRVCVRAWLRACVAACVRGCVRGCVRACVAAAACRCGHMQALTFGGGVCHGARAGRRRCRAA
eukprot:2881043-Rhodomonas_salina.1